MRKNGYSHKPAPRFFGTGDTFLGVELEVEAPDSATEQRGLEVERNPSWCYAKRDGSLGQYGWEMVTHPISLSLWMGRQEVRDYHNVPSGTTLTGHYKGTTYTATMLHGGRVEWSGVAYGSISAAARAITGKSANGYVFFGLTRPGRTARENNPAASFFRLTKQLKDMGYTSHDNERCGFHVHVSRKAFSADGTLSNPRFFRFKSLVNGALFRKLSQRREFRFCQQEPVTPENYLYQSTRYSAVNMTNATVEVRIFRGNLREARLRKNLEAVIAALEFAKEATDYAPPADQQFVEFARRNADRFPNLVAYIASLDGVEGGE